MLKSYERYGYFDEVLSLLEAALSLERAHVSFFLSRLALSVLIIWLDGNLH